MMKKITWMVLVLYVATLFSRAVPLVSADEKMLEGKIMGTGPGKVWILIGANQGVTEDMIFEVRHDGAVIGKIKVKKVGNSSSEAEIIEIAREDVKISPGDMARWMLPPEFKVEEEKVKPATTPVTELQKKEEEKTEKPKIETKPEVKKEETVAVKPVETKKEEKPKKTVKKKSGGIFGSKMWLYAAIAGAAAFALAGKGKSSGSAANPTGESVSSSSDNTPSIPF